LPDGRRFEFPLDGFAQTCLLEGVDQLGYLLKQQPAIDRFEAERGTRPSSIQRAATAEVSHAR
jgi:3-isopropylmalate/(R)-2-methylmalate dehydratase small subunit